jgi:cellulose 1,4-beta-cellobiosidase
MRLAEASFMSLQQEEFPMRDRSATAFVAVLLASAGCAGGLGTVGASDPPSPTRANPFKDVDFFVNPEYAASVEATAKRHPEEADLLRKAARYPTGVWLSDIKAVGSLQRWLDEAKRQQDAHGKPTMAVVVVYDLPDRDCAAESSAGELKVAEDGEARYRREFIDPITAQFKAHPDQPIAVVLEPDSLGNLATNMGLPKCQEARAAYKNGIVYAIRSFRLPNVSVYLDAAHAGWLGWDDNRAKIAKVFKSVLNDAGGPEMIRGFAVNTSNYTHLSNRDGAVLEPTNPCPNELTYVKQLRETLAMYGFHDHGFLVDTSRNGRGGIRTAWGNWCNIRGAGLGERPRADPAPGIDAYYWVKPPGESDGSSDPNGPRFDPMCAGRDAAQAAPQAGQWFESYFIDLVHNANPPL